MMNRHQRRAQQSTAAARFRMERNSVLRSLDVNEMTAFFKRWQQPLPDKWATDKPNAQLATMHYARLQVTDMTHDERLLSAKWLVANTYSLPSGFAIEGDELTFTKPNDPAANKPNFGMDGPSGDDMRKAHELGLLPYIFFRNDDTFYPLECKGDEAAAEQAAMNPGTIRVERLDGTIVWTPDMEKKSATLN